MALSTGQIFNNRYRIVKLLKLGGFGAVYRAWDIASNGAVALKENLETSLNAQRQFEHEAALLQGLSHPNLVKVTDYFSIPGQGQYLIMDYIEGDDLDQKLEQKGAVFSESELLPWMLQMCDVLDYLHLQTPPIIHRDIKPANIKITPQGRALLVDFGIAKAYSAKLKTTIGARAVTPGYSPPEQYGHGTTDARTDIYALGATYYALLTGQEPAESTQRLTNDSLQMIRKVSPTVSINVEKAIHTALALNPVERFQSAGDFKLALEGRYVYQAPFVPAPKPITPQPPIPVPPVVKNVGVSSGWQVIAIICMLAVFVLFVWSVYNQSETRKSESRLGVVVSEYESTVEAVKAGAQATLSVYESIIADQQYQIKNLHYLVGVGPYEGAIQHNMENNAMEGYSVPNINLSDFVTEVNFYNPYSASQGSWDYGFLFRDAGEGRQFRLSIRSDKSWELINWINATSSNRIAGGIINNLIVNSGGVNTISLIANKNNGYLYVNNIFISKFDLSSRTNSGNVIIATGMESGDEKNGYETRYKDFMIWAFP